MLISVIDIKSFYPKELSIVDVEDTDKRITIYMHSTSTLCTCHRCGALLRKHHGSHHRVVQDLPILEKHVLLDMQIYDYACDSETCRPFAPTETFDGFLNYKSSMTNRLEDFACVLAIETSCESSARTMRSMNIKSAGTRSSARF